MREPSDLPAFNAVKNVSDKLPRVTSDCLVVGSVSFADKKAYKKPIKSTECLAFSLTASEEIDRLSPYPYLGVLGV